MSSVRVAPRLRLRAALGAGLCLLGVALAPATALAGSASTNSSILTFTAANGEANELGASLGSGYYMLTDRIPIYAGEGCAQWSSPAPGRYAVVCSAGSVSTVVLNAGDGADSVIAPTSGTYYIKGGPGADQLRGGPGNDTLDGGTGADLMAGGGGFDYATYSSRTAPVTVTLDDAPGDGEAGEGDNVTGDIEGLYGGWNTDDLTGGPAANRLYGAVGNDVLNGAGGDDYLEGSFGDDRLDSGSGVDDLHGNSGRDTLLTRDDAADLAACGSDADVLMADTIDRLAVEDCETVERVATAAPPADAPPASGTDPQPAPDDAPAPGQEPPVPADEPPPPPVGPIASIIGAAAVFFAPSSTVRLEISCASKLIRSCRGRVDIYAEPTRSKASRPLAGSSRRGRRGARLGSASYRIAPGRSAPVAVKLSRRGRKAARKSATVRVVVTTRDAAGKSTTVERSVRVRPSRRSRRAGRR